MRWSLAAVLIGSIALFSGCSDSKTEPKQRDPANISATGSSQRAAVDTELPDSIKVLVTDDRGDPVSGVDVEWAITTVPATGGEAGRGTLSATIVQTDADGYAGVVWTMGKVAGRNQATATVAELIPAIFTATALPGAPATIQVMHGTLPLDTLELAVGDTFRLGTLVVDRYENLISSPDLEWSSTSAEIADVSDSGLVRGRTAGQAIVEASATSASGDLIRAGVVVDVIPPGDVYIGVIEPALLTPGSEATITGAGFNPDPSRNEVTVDGQAATVTAATATSLTIALPPAASFGCQPTRDVEVVVKAMGESVRRDHPLAVARQVPELGIGEYLNIATATDVRCNEIPQTGGRYLISVYNTNTNPQAITDFSLKGDLGLAVPGRTAAPLTAIGTPQPQSTLIGDSPATGRAAVTSAVSSRPSPSNLMVGGARGGQGPVGDALARDRAHLELLEKNIRLVERLGSPVQAFRAERAATGRTDQIGPALAAAPTPLIEGSVVDLKIPNIRGADLCADYLPVRARVVYAGPKAVVLEDSVADLAGQMDAKYRELGQEFESTMYTLIEEYFGDPFAMDATIGGGGRILMLFSPKVNDFGQVAGFVTTADMFPQGRCASSDEAQIFYALVPTSAEPGFGGSTIDGWHRSIRSTVIHEVKHITSFAERLSRDATTLEASWLEESTARISEELWARRIFGYTHKGKTDYNTSIYCEVRPSFPECSGSPLVMLNHFHGLEAFMTQSTKLSSIGPSFDGDWTFYGTGWHLVRWSIDHFADSEAAFLRSLTQETTLSGVNNLTSKTGQSLAELLGPWSLSLSWDQPTSPGLSNPSWDIHDIYRGLNDDFPDTFTRSYPLRPMPLAFGAFAANVNEIRGGATQLFALTGNQQGTQLIQLLSSSGGAPAGTLRIAILRTH